MKLIITEKPSVAREFAKALKLNTVNKGSFMESGEWIITWCVGHLVTMSYPEKYNENLKFWRLDTLPFMPKEYKYEVIKNVSKQFDVVQKLLQREDVTEIYNAGDSGREGEYIQRLVFMMAKPNPNAKMKRVWIDSQTEEEILRGIREAKDMTEYDSISDSAYLRAKEDYLIGINFSRLLTIIYGRRMASKINEEKATIAVGRVMTCVLGMVVSREREIRNFVKTKYYKILGEFGNDKGSFKAEWKVNEKSKMFDSPKLYNESGFKKEETAKSFIAELVGKEAVVTEMKKNKQKVNAPLLFDLGELQNECTKRFKINPDETLEIIQNLYEKKLLTYPRTDAKVLSTAIAKEITKNLNGLAKGYKDEEVQNDIKRMIDEKYSTDLTKTKYVDDKKITDHYAIIPTGQGFENYESLPELQKRVYKVVVKRFLAIFYPPAEYSKVNVTVNIENETFYASGKVCINRGYLDVLKPEKKEEQSTVNAQNVENSSENNLKKDLKSEIKNEQVKDNEEKNVEEETEGNLEILKTLKKNEKLGVKNFELKDAETSPPTRYNSGNIILAMRSAGKLIEDEELREQIKGDGIGTAATRGEIIKKLVRIQYIQINDKTKVITPTVKGEAIYDVINSSMPDMLNPDLTASWEKGLGMVARKEIKPEVFMEKLEKYINSKFDKLVIRR